MIKYNQALVLIVFVVFSWVDLSAQLITNHVVYLKNGSVIRGKILEQTADNVKIETNCQNIFVFETDKILEIKQEESPQSQMNQKDNFAPDMAKGFYSYSTIGILTGNSEVTDNFTFSFQTSAGYEFTQYFGAGLGLGIENLRTEIIPVYLSIKSNILKGANTPIINLQVGYSFPLSKTKTDEYGEYKYEGGFNLGVDFGICSFKSNHRAFTITAGYCYQILKETNNYNYYYYWGESAIETNTYEFNKIAIRIGFMFR